MAKRSTKKDTAPKKEGNTLKEDNTLKESKALSVRVEWFLLAFLTILFIASIVTGGYSRLPFNLKIPFLDKIQGMTVMSTEEIQEKTTKFINDEFFGGEEIAEIQEVTEDEDSDLYKLKLIVQGQEYESFVSKDGKFLYIERTVMNLQEMEDSGSGEIAVDEYPMQDTPEVLLFTMSYCPYGNIAEEFVDPVARLLGGSADIQPHYVIYNESYGYEGSEYCLDAENQYCSMHGIQELNQDVRELCTYKYQKDKFWDFIAAVNDQCDSTNVDECWEGVAQGVGLDTNQIKTCQADEAYDLLAQEVQLNQEYSVTGSPTIIINGQQYGGDRTAEAFKLAVCASYNSKPGECDQVLDDTGSDASGSCE